MKRILSLDVGKKRTGVAISDPTQTFARVYTTIITGDYRELAARVSKICEKEDVELIVIGYPLLRDGSIGDKAREIMDFKEYLDFKTQLPSVLEDERYTSEDAKETIRFLGRSVKKNKQSIDQIAAVMILQAYLSEK